MAAFVGRDVHEGRLAVAVSDRRVEQILGCAGDARDVAQRARRGPQDAESPAGGDGVKQMAGAEHLVVVVRQDEHGRARPGANAIRESGGRPCVSYPGHKAIVRYASATRSKVAGQVRVSAY